MRFAFPGRSALINPSITRVDRGRAALRESTARASKRLSNRHRERGRPNPPIAPLRTTATRLAPVRSTAPGPPRHRRRPLFRGWKSAPWVNLQPRKAAGCLLGAKWTLCDPSHCGTRPRSTGKQAEAKVRGGELGGAVGEGEVASEAARAALVMDEGSRADEDLRAGRGQRVDHSLGDRDLAEGRRVDGVAIRTPRPRKPRRSTRVAPARRASASIAAFATSTLAPARVVPGPRGS